MTIIRKNCDCCGGFLRRLRAYTVATGSLLLLSLSFLSSPASGSVQDSIQSDTLERSWRAQLSAVKHYAVPALMINYGLLSFNDHLLKNADHHFQHEISENYSGFKTTVEDKLQYAPILAVYTLDVVGVKGQHNFVDRSGIFLMSTTLMSISVDGLKDKTHRLRPSAQDRRSFPSGHTANAFLGAEIMRQEFKDTSPWYGYAGYTLAGTTGVLRLLNNDHWFSDVVAGAGIGIASAKLAYVVYPWAKKKIFNHKDSPFIVLPTATQGRYGFTLVAGL